uniref:Olfactory specific protein-like protein n=1 Tax=Cynops pyrrhogaster TaxID=8330 RepID=B6ZIT0_CYNPY|nr:olfactory specific protein-like protein [Cynops pyrrhogaster]
MSAMWISLGLLFSGLLQLQAMEIPVMSNFDPQKILGKWYAVAVASNCPEFVQMKSVMKMPITIFSVLDDGDLYAATGVAGPSGCMTMDMVYHTAKHGQYTQSVLDNSDIRFVDGDFDHSVLEYTQNVSESGDACKMVKLLARQPEVAEIPALAIEHFKMLIPVVGLSMEDVTHLPRDIDCVPGEF